MKPNHLKLNDIAFGVKTMIVSNYTNKDSARVRRSYESTYFLGQLIAMVSILKQIKAQPAGEARDEQLTKFKEMCLEFGNMRVQALATFGAA